MSDTLPMVPRVKSHRGEGIVLKTATFLHPQELLTTDSAYLCMMFGSDMICVAPCCCIITCRSADAVYCAQQQHREACMQCRQRCRGRQEAEDSDPGYLGANIWFNRYCLCRLCVCKAHKAHVSHMLCRSRQQASSVSHVAHMTSAIMLTASCWQQHQSCCDIAGVWAQTLSHCSS